MIKRRLKWAGKILLSLLLLLIAIILLERWRGQFALAKFKHTLQARGEQLTPQDLASRFDPADNGAPAAMAAIRQFTNGLCLPHNPPPAMRIQPSGRAVIGAREPEWYDQDPIRNDQFLKGIFTNHWAELELDLQQNAAPLTALQSALRQPVLNHQLDLGAGSKLTFTHLAATRSAATWFAAASLNALHQDRPAAAREFLIPQISLPRLLAEDHLAISELVRIAIHTLNRATIWETLHTSSGTELELSALQQAGQAQTFSSNMVTALVGERIYMAGSFREMRASNDHTYDLLGCILAGAR